MTPSAPTLRGATARDGRKFTRGADGTYNVSTGPQLFGAGAFQAVKRAGFKGLFFVPDLAPMRRMTPITREWVNRAAQWLYDNVGLASSIVDRLAVYEAGSGMWPKAATSNDAFNKIATDIFHQGVKDPRFFDMAKMDSFYSAQVNIRRHIRLYGDHFGQLIRSSDPGPNTPRVRFLPGYTCANPRTTSPVALQGWKDGVQTDEFGAITAFRFLTSDAGDKWQDVPADDVLHFHDLFLSGQTRGLSAFSKFAEKLFTIDDIERAEANGALSRARMGYALTVPDDNGTGPRLSPPGTDSTELYTNPDGSPFAIHRVKFNDGESMEVPELPPGYDIKTVESARPGPNLIAFFAELKEDIAFATGYLPEFIAFMARSGGAVSRFIIEDSQLQINHARLNQLEPQFSHRYYIFSLWQRIKSGAFAASGVPADWFRYRMIYPKLITVDKKNDARIDDGRLDTGKMSPVEYHGQLGQDNEDVEEEVIRGFYRRRQRVEEIAQEMNVDPADYNEIFRPPVGSAPPEPDPEETPEDPIPPSKKTEDDPPPPPPPPKPRTRVRR